MRIGRTTRIMTDRERENPFEQDGSKRRFMVSIYYPAAISGSAIAPGYPALFYPGEEIAIDFFKRFGADTDYLTALRTDVHENAPIIDGVYPVIVLSPAFGIERDMYWCHIYNLVVKGFIVITVGATYDAVFTVFPDREHIPQLEALSNLQSSDVEAWESLVTIRTKDLHYVLDRLPELNNTDALLRNKLDLERMGLMGHSLGGAAVYRVLKENASIKAGILLDPSLHLLGTDTSPLTTPILLMRQNSSTYEMLIQNRWDETLARDTMKGQSWLDQTLVGYKSFIRIDDANHVTFSDVPIHFNEPGIMAKHHMMSELITSFMQEFVCDQTDAYTKSVGTVSGISLIDRNGYEIN